MKPCRCGHDRALHQHHRAGTDCPLCACRRYRRRRWWHRHTPSVPAAGGKQATAPPAWPDPPPGLPRHDTGPIAVQSRRYQCGCVFIYDGDGNITDAKGCRTVADLRQWDRELRT